MLTIILVLSMMTIVALTVSAATSGDYEFDVTNNQVTITKYTGVGVGVALLLPLLENPYCSGLQAILKHVSNSDIFTAFANP